MVQEMRETVVNIHEAKTHLSRLLEQVAAGERIVIAKAGRPVADLVAHRPVDIVFGTLELKYPVEAFSRETDDEVATMLGAE